MDLDWATKRKLTAMARTRHTADGSQSAGALGEEKVVAIVKKVTKGRQCEVFSSIRVPKAEEKGKFEIDVLVVGTHDILALEVKSWVGSIRSGKKGEWMQTTTSGHTLSHKNPALLLDRKLDALLSYLELNGVSVAKERFSSALVWTFPIDLEQGLKDQCPSVTIDDLESFLQGRLFRSDTRADPSPIDKLAVTAAFDRLPTWDQIYLRGGQIVRGDISYSSVTTKIGKVSRADTEAMIFHYPGFLLSWLFFAPKVWWTDRSGKKRAAKLDPEQYFVIRLSGQAKELRYHLAEIHKVSFGWCDESYYRSIAPAHTSYALGTEFEAKVVQICDYGVFVRLDPYRDALFHSSDMGDKSVKDFKLDMIIRVKIVRVKTNESGKTLLNVSLT